MRFLYWCRSLLFYLGYACGALFYGLFCSLVAPWLAFPRRYALVTRFNRFVIWWCQRSCGVRYVIEGAEHIPAQPCVVVSNHQSAWETYLLGTLFVPQSTVLKRELIYIPVFGWALRLLNPIAINRKKPTLALKQLVQQGTRRLRDGSWVVIFPEGTRVRPGQVKKFGKGGALLAQQAEVAILPVALNSGCCWPAGSMMKTPGVIHVRIGPPISSVGIDRDELHQRCEHWIRSAMTELGVSDAPASEDSPAIKTRDAGTR